MISPLAVVSDVAVSADVDDCCVVVAVVDAYAYAYVDVVDDACAVLDVVHGNHHLLRTIWNLLPP